MALVNWQTEHGNAFVGTAALVTGGAGFIGSHLTEALIDLGARVTVLDDLSGGDTANFDAFGDRAGERLRFVEGSITDRAAVDDAMGGCSLVFHQAAMGSVPRSVEMPGRYHEVNVAGTLNVLEAARAPGSEVCRVMFAASSSAYGDTPTLPKVESMPVLPRSPYAANKVAGEAMLRAWALSYAGAGGAGGPDTVSLRYFNIFGPRQNANSAYAAVIAAFADALMRGRHPQVHGDGGASRDFTFVDNAVHANLLAARYRGRLDGEVFNVACGGSVTINRLAMYMADLLGRPGLTPEHGPDRAGDVKHSLADLTRIRRTLKYEPVVGFEKGLAQTVWWYAAEAGEGMAKSE